MCATRARRSWRPRPGSRLIHHQVGPRLVGIGVRLFQRGSHTGACRGNSFARILSPARRSGIGACSVPPKTAQVPDPPNESSASSSSSVGPWKVGARSSCDARAAGRSDRQSRSGSALTWSLVRPLSTERGWSSGSSRARRTRHSCAATATAPCQIREACRANHQYGRRSGCARARTCHAASGPPDRNAAHRSRPPAGDHRRRPAARCRRPRRSHRRPVPARRDDALEIEVLPRVVLGMERQVLGHPPAPISRITSGAQH